MAKGLNKNVGACVICLLLSGLVFLLIRILMVAIQGSLPDWAWKYSNEALMVMSIALVLLCLLALVYALRWAFEALTYSR